MMVLLLWIPLLVQHIFISVVSVSNYPCYPILAWITAVKNKSFFASQRREQ